jgi:hypothetical protein
MFGDLISSLFNLGSGIEKNTTQFILHHPIFVFRLLCFSDYEAV